PPLSRQIVESRASRDIWRLALARARLPAVGRFCGPRSLGRCGSFRRLICRSACTGIALSTGSALGVLRIFVGIHVITPCCRTWTRLGFKPYSHPIFVELSTFAPSACSCPCSNCNLYGTPVAGPVNDYLRANLR